MNDAVMDGFLVRVFDHRVFRALGLCACVVCCCFWDVGFYHEF